MKKKLMASVLLGTMSMSMLAGCSKAPEVSTADSDTKASETEYVSKSDLTIEKKVGSISEEDAGKFRQGYLDFSLAMIKKNLEHDGNDKNVMISPASIMLALDMAASGAEGDTLEQIMQLFGGDKDPQGQLSYAADLLKRMNETEGVKLHAADSIWVNKDIMPGGLKSDYTDFVKKYFEAELDSLTFDKAAEDRINNWVSDKTDKMIPSIVNDLDPQTAMMLINAICFDGKWAKQYDEYQVKEGTFKNAAGQDKTVNMMRNSESLYVENDQAEGFIKYYEGGQYAFVVMLPKDKSQNAGDIISGFTGESFDEYINSATDDYILFGELPQFKYDWDGSIVDQLKALGMEVPFDSDKADFSGTADNGKDLYITDIIHKTHIEVDQNGTKAAAVTAISEALGAIMEDPRQTKEVICDRPFAYAIVDTNDNTPIFIGTVNDI